MTDLERVQRQLKKLCDILDTQNRILMKNYKPARKERPCWYKTKDSKQPAIFHCFSEEEFPGVKQVFAILELEDGTVKKAKPSSVIFLDSSELFDEFAKEVDDE